MTTPNPTAEQAERVSMEVLDEYRKTAAWLEAQAATRGPVGDTMHGLAAEALTNLIEHEYSRHTIPLYGMLDLWIALNDTSHPEFDEFYDEHGYAETWSRMLDGVRRLRRAHGLLSEGAPTAEQVTRAHRAYYEANPDGGYRQAMRAALTAAGIAPQELSECVCTPAIAGISDGPSTDCPEPGEPTDREKLIANLRRRAEQSSNIRMQAEELHDIADALTAPLDPEKVAEVLLLLMRDEAMLFDNGTEEWIAESDPVECLPPLARALCEAHKEGKLNG